MKKNFYYKEIDVKRKKLVFLILPIFMVQCAYYYKWFGAESSLYTVQEQKILQETMEVTDFGYGFDQRMKLDYVFMLQHSTKGMAKKKKAVTAIMKKAGPKQAVVFYEKIYRLYLVTRYTMEEAKEAEDWNDYTYVNKYLLPPLKLYTSIIREATLNVSGAYKKTIGTRHKEIEAEVKKDFD